MGIKKGALLGHLAILAALSGQGITEEKPRLTPPPKVYGRKCKNPSCENQNWDEKRSYCSGDCCREHRKQLGRSLT